MFAATDFYFLCEHGTFRHGRFDEHPLETEQIAFENEEGLTCPSFCRDAYGKEYYNLIYAYKQAVQDFTVRNLTLDRDILNAFTGICSVLEGHFAWNLPDVALDAAILWRPRGDLKRRPYLDTSTSEPLPSWSWVGWKGAIWYDDRVLCLPLKLPGDPEHSLLRPRTSSKLELSTSVVEFRLGRIVHFGDAYYEHQRRRFESKAHLEARVTILDRHGFVAGHICIATTDIADYTHPRYIDVSSTHRQNHILSDALRDRYDFIVLSKSSFIYKS